MHTYKTFRYMPLHYIQYVHACKHTYTHTNIQCIHSYKKNMHYITRIYACMHPRIHCIHIRITIGTYLQTSIKLQFTTLQDTALRYAALHYIHTYISHIHTYMHASCIHYITLHYITSPYITLHYVTLRCITLLFTHTYIHTYIHYNTLHKLHTVRTYIHTYIHTRMHACTHACIHTLHTYISRRPLASSAYQAPLVHHHAAIEARVEGGSNHSLPSSLHRVHPTSPRGGHAEHESDITYHEIT